MESEENHQALNPLVVVLGPTASGKSSLAMEIAKRFGGEVVNFDSVQVYRGFDIGSAKTPAAERRGIPHHLLDICDPSERMTAGNYARRARPVLAEITARGHLPVLTGGTGFYLRALVEGLFTGPERNEDLRRRLQHRAARWGSPYLHRLLSRLDAAAAGRIHPNDQPKVIRAIEVCLLGHTPMSSQWEQGRDALSGYRVIRIGLDPPREELYARIEARAERMFSKGLLDEIRDLLASGVPESAWAFGSLGYKQALQHLRGELSLEEAITETAQHTRRYAKRQMTWFRREREVKWFRGFGEEAAMVNRVLVSLEARIDGPVRHRTCGLTSPNQSRER